MGVQYYLSYITTYTNKRLNPIKADAKDIDIKDIAHSLSLLCRANGHFPHFYSVAQHSLNFAKEAEMRGYSKRVQLGCLLHDSSEAYLSDVTRPVKAQLPEYLRIEERLQNAIFDKWIIPSLTQEELKMVFEIDDAVLYYEFLELMNEKIAETQPYIKSKIEIKFKDFSYIENRFIKTFNALLGIQRDKYVGVDWMSGRWIAVELSKKIASIYTFENIAELCGFYEDVDEILIDVPIGLPETREEVKNRPDQCAREYLKNPQRKSSVFNVPFRQMVYAKDKTEFWSLRDILGAKVSVQSFGIIKCIKDADSFLTANPQWKNRLLESHPECSFQALNNGNGLKYSKHTKDGIKLRTEILSQYVDNIELLLDSVSEENKRDVLDALCLAVTSQVGYKSLPPKPIKDSKGLKMQILIAEL